MGLRETCWVVCLAGLPFSNFLNRSLDLWHGHAMWIECWLPILVGLNFFYSTPPRPPNKAFGVWIGLVGLSTVGLWYVLAGQAKAYPVSLLMPLLHLLALVVFIWSAWMSWTASFVTKLLTWIGLSGLLSLVYGLVQVANVDQFFKPLLASATRDALVGTIGNYNHFAVYLAMLLPIYLWMKTRWKYLFLAVLLVLVLLTRSDAGYLSVAAVLLWEFYHRSRRVFFWMLFLGTVLFIYAWTYDDSAIASLRNRLERWGFYWQIAKDKFITGQGPGMVFEYAKTIDLADANNTPHHPLWHWRHVHNEYLQILVEQGLLGLMAFGYLVIDAAKSAWRLRAHREARVCAGMLLAILSNALFNFPFHLWMLSSLGLMAYVGIKVIEAESCPS